VGRAMAGFLGKVELLTKVPSGTTAKQKAHQNQLPTRRNPPAILVRVKKGDYTEGLKKVKHSESFKKVFDRIMVINKLKDGNLLV